MNLATRSLHVAFVLAAFGCVSVSLALVETKLVYGPPVSDANRAWYACLFGSAEAAVGKLGRDAAASSIAETALSACTDGEDIVREAMLNDSVYFVSVETQIERIKEQFRDAIEWDLAHRKK